MELGRCLRCERITQIEYHHTPLPEWIGGISIKPFCPKCHRFHEAKQRKALLEIIRGKKPTLYPDKEIEELKGQIKQELQRLYGSKPLSEILLEHASFKDHLGGF